jgi:hypothetical protein
MLAQKRSEAKNKEARQLPVHPVYPVKKSVCYGLIRHGINDKVA